MRSRHVFAAGLVCAVCVVAPAPVSGDFYDRFDDGSYCQDPNDPNVFDRNLWDVDDPHWKIGELIGAVWLEDANSGQLRLYVQGVLSLGFLGATVDDGDHDPNPSTAYFDNTAAHYVLSNIGTNPLSPNEGSVLIFTHGDFVTWTGYAADYNFHDNYFMLDWVEGLDFVAVGHMQMKPPEEIEPDEANGFWLVFQFDPAGPNGTDDPNDPNNHWFGSAIWNGGKFDWDGTWTLETPIINSHWDPNEETYWTEGGSGVSSVASQWTGPTVSSDAVFDDIECRWGTFTNVFRTLTVVMKDCCELGLEPNLAHPGGGNNRQYTHGTAIVLDGVVPCGNKSFKKWTVKGPNDSGDPAYQIVTDTNEVLYLTMDGDYLVKATCKCGGGGVEPFAAVVLLLLGLGAVIRRAA